MVAKMAIYFFRFRSQPIITNATPAKKHSRNISMDIKAIVLSVPRSI